MAVDRTDDLIEISDPSAEIPAFEPPPRVVIEYRDRGIPWMLVPPLLILSAAFAVVGFRAYTRSRPDLARSRPIEEPAASADPVPPSILEAPAPGPAPVPAPTPEAAPPVAPPLVLVSEPPAPEVPAVPPSEPTSPRVQGLGFDPRALEANPLADPALAPTAGDDRRPGGPMVEPARPPEVDPRDQPAEVDPNLLPPDPRLAYQLRLQRIAEGRRQVEAERAEYHAALAVICRKYREKSAPLITLLGQRYAAEIDPTIREKAAQVLNGPGAGAARPVRINLLRSLGFPEPLILGDIFDNDMRWLGEGKKMSSAERGAPRTKEEVMYRSALILLSYPPTRAATPAPTRTRAAAPSASPSDLMPTLDPPR